MTADQNLDEFEELRSELLDSIDASKNGQRRLKIKTLLGQFGFIAVQRVRQSSLAHVLDQLSDWMGRPVGKCGGWRSKSAAPVA